MRNNIDRVTQLVVILSTKYHGLLCGIYLKTKGGVIMENIKKVGQFNMDIWFSYFSQGFYFSVGYFTLAKTSYCATLLKNLYNDRIDIRAIGDAVLY